MRGLRKDTTQQGEIVSTFFGTSSVYVTDGTTHIFVDAFLTRPSLVRSFLRKLAPDATKIDAALTRGGVSELDALFVAHSHHDHVMDAPEVIKRTGGTLYGSASTLNVGRGEGLEEIEMKEIKGGDTFRIGEFTVSIIEAPHSPGNIFPGKISEALTAPSRIHRFRDGGCFVFHFEHPSGTLLVLPSANYIPGFLEGFRADVVYLGIGALGKQSDEFKENYWAYTVEQVRPRLIIPIHWDHFGRSLSKPFKPLPFPADNIRASRKFLAAKTEDNEAKMHFPDPFESVTQSPRGVCWS